MASPGELLRVSLPLVVGLALLAIAAMVAKHGWRHRHNRFFAALYGISGVKSVSEGLGPVADNFASSAALFPSSATWLLVGSACALAMTPLLLLFVASFPRPTSWMRQRPILGALVFVPSLLVAFVLFSSTDPLVQFQVLLGFSLFSTGVTVAALALLNIARVQSPDHIERQQAGYVMIGFLPAFVATWSLTTLYFQFGFGLVSQGAAQIVLDFVIGILSPLFEIVAAGMIAVAILKFNLMGVDPKFRLGVKSAIIAVMFATVFLVTQFIENVVLQGKVFSFAGEYGSFLLSGTTSLILFKPMEMASNRVSNKLLPDTKQKDVLQSRAAEVYHAQCTYVLRDSHVSDREMAFLHNLRDQLGLSEAKAKAIEQTVENVLKVDSPHTGQATGSAGS